MTTDGGQDEGFAVPLTQRVQTQLIIDAVPDVHVHPRDWLRQDDGVEYLCRRGSVVVRDWHVPRVQAALERRLGVPEARHAVHDVGGTTTRLSWDEPDGGASVHETVAELDEAVGPGVAAPDHLLYVCGVHPCAAVEQEPVAASAAPVPSPPSISADTAPEPGLGRGVQVLVMDTGLVSAATEHWWMRGVTGEPDTPYDPRTGELRQDGGHGTFVAGCVRAVAPRAHVHVADATRDLPLQGANGMIGAVFESDLARLVRARLVAPAGSAAAVRVPDVLVLSVAGTTRNDVPPLALTALYEDVIQHLKGLLIVAPAGNEGDDRRNWPASFSWVVSVGALTADGAHRAAWSNHGRTVDVYAPGEDLVNAYASGRYTYAWDGPQRGETVTFTGMAKWSGTSFSAPLVAGLVAKRMSETGQNSTRAWLSLLAQAEGHVIPGVGPALSA